MGRATLTANWVLIPSMFSTAVIRLSDLAWVYRKDTKHSVNFIPTGTSYESVLWQRCGSMHSVTGSQEMVASMLEALAARAPWVVIGYSKVLENAWDKDRRGFLAAVDQGRG